MLWPAGGCEMSPPKYLPGNPTSTGPVSVVIFWDAFASYLPSPWLDRYRLNIRRCWSRVAQVQSILSREDQYYRKPGEKRPFSYNLFDS